MQACRAMFFSCLLLSSCTSDSSNPDDAGADDGDASVASDATIDAGPGADVDGNVDEVDPTVLTNFSFDDARHVTLGPTGVLQPLESATQVDYYTFDAQAGEVYVISTNRGPFTPDNVLTLYGPDRDKLAENDTGWVWPGDAIDARLVVRAQETGAYYVVVEDRVLPDAAFAEGVPSFFYRLIVVRAEPSTMGFGWEADASDETATVAFARDMITGLPYVTLIGQLEEGEVDHFTLRGGAARALIGHVLPGGVTGNGSTITTGRVDVRDADDHLVAAIDRAAGAENIHPPVEDSGYTLSVSADGAVGDNGFYAIDLVLMEDNPLEQATDNDSIETAHVLDLGQGFLRRGTILVQLPAADSDYFTFDAMAGERLDVICEGESAGSGVRGLVAELRDANDEVLGEASESIETGLRLEQVIVSEAGSYYLRLSSDTPDDSEAAPAWVRCAVIAEI
jgi:hypothetical protein